MTCKYTPNDAILKLCEDSLTANNAELSLPITNLIEAATNIASALKSVPLNIDSVNQSLNVLYAEKKQQHTKIDFVQKLAAISEVPEGMLSQQELKATQDFMRNSASSTQTPNPANAGQRANIDITQITINLLKLSGYVLLVTEGNTNSAKKVAAGADSDQVKGTRFLYAPKPSKAERNHRLEALEALEGERTMGKDSRERPTPLNKNHHPTVKGQALMRYLITLITPPEGTVLDMFMGSGSTGVAAKALGHSFVGIELDPEYFKIAQARITKTKVGEPLEYDPPVTVDENQLELFETGENPE